MKVLVLDDEDYRHRGYDEALVGHEVHHVRTVDQFRKKVAKCRDWDLVSFDHDLGTKEDGRDAARAFVASNAQPSCLCVVHSWNPAGATRIADVLSDAARHFIRHPFGTTLLETVLPSLGFCKIVSRRSQL